MPRESRPESESLLADLAIGDLTESEPPRNDEVVTPSSHAYAALEVIRDVAPPSDFSKTMQYQRKDRSQDFVATMKLTGPLSDMYDTVPIERGSEPYERIVLEKTSATVAPTPRRRTITRPHTIKADSRGTSQYIRPSGSLEIRWFAASDEALETLEDATPIRASRLVIVIAVITLLLGALALGVGIAFLAL